MLAYTVVRSLAADEHPACRTGGSAPLSVRSEPPGAGNRIRAVPAPGVLPRLEGTRRSVLGGLARPPQPSREAMSMSGPHGPELTEPLRPAEVVVGGLFPPKHPRVCDACDHGQCARCTPCPVCGAPCLCPHEVEAFKPDGP